MKFKLVNTDMESDLPQLDAWDRQISYGNKKFSSIKSYILEDNVYYTLREVVRLNHERYPIGDDERKYCFSIKDKDNKLLGFVMCVLFNMNSKPELFIQYVVIHPDVQNKDLGSWALSELMYRSKKYMAKKPTFVQAYVHKRNIPSLMMMKKLGFDHIDANENYFKVEKSLEHIKDL